MPPRTERPPLTGSGGLERLLGTGLPGRLVGVDGALSYAGGWPPDGELQTDS